MRSRAIGTIVEQHVEEAATLRHTRRVLLSAPRVTLRDLARHDSRIEAQLDALAIAGEDAWAPCEAALEDGSVGALFTAAVRAIEDQQLARFDRLLLLAPEVPRGLAGIVSAFGWLEPDKLRGLVSGLLRSQEDARRVVGLAACGAHRVDPGLGSGRFIEDKAPDVRARALRIAGDLGHVESLSACIAATKDEDIHCRFWASWSAILLGDRNRALEVLMQIGLVEGPHRETALFISLMAAHLPNAHGVLQQIARQPQHLRLLTRGSGLVGDPSYISWLIGNMKKDRCARLAGEAFTFITGADLRLLKLTRTSPADHESGPNDDSEDPDVGMDEDDDLPWPDPEKVQVWWDANVDRFRAGGRHFMGEMVTEENCQRVLKQGCQRQRIAAAVYLSLLNPGTPLFEWRAPAFRQQRLLTAMV